MRQVIKLLKMQIKKQIPYIKDKGIKYICNLPDIVEYQERFERTDYWSSPPKSYVQLRNHKFRTLVMITLGDINEIFLRGAKVTVFFVEENDGEMLCVALKSDGYHKDILTEALSCIQVCNEGALRFIYGAIITPRGDIFGQSEKYGPIPKITSLIVEACVKEMIKKDSV